MLPFRPHIGCECLRVHRSIFLLFLFLFFSPRSPWYRESSLHEAFAKRPCVLLVGLIGAWARLPLSFFRQGDRQREAKLDRLFLEKAFHPTSRNIESHAGKGQFYQARNQVPFCFRHVGHCTQFTSVRFKQPGDHSRNLVQC